MVFSTLQKVKKRELEEYCKCIQIQEKKLKKASFAFIDGGHSEETVRSDYENLKHIPCIVFDDFFSKDEKGNILDDEYLGTNRLVESLKDKRKYRGCGNSACIPRQRIQS